MKNNRADRENDKFKAVGLEELTAVRVSLDESVPVYESVDNNFSNSNSAIVASGATSTIYSESFTEKCLISGILLSGENIATYSVKKNGFLVSRHRTNWTNLNADIQLNLIFEASDTIDIEVFNYRPTPSSFEVCVKGRK